MKKKIFLLIICALCLYTVGVKSVFAESPLITQDFDGDEVAGIIPADDDTSFMNSIHVGDTARLMACDYEILTRLVLEKINADDTLVPDTEEYYAKYFDELFGFAMDPKQPYYKNAIVTSKITNWASSNTNVATINQSGVATAVGVGKTTIIGSYTKNGNNYTLSYNLAVSDASLISLAGDTKETNNILTGKETTLKFKIDDSISSASGRYGYEISVIGDDEFKNWNNMIVRSGDDSDTSDDIIIKSEVKDGIIYATVKITKPGMYRMYVNLRGNDTGASKAVNLRVTDEKIEDIPNTAKAGTRPIIGAIALLLGAAAIIKIVSANKLIKNK